MPAGNCPAACDDSFPAARGWPAAIYRAAMMISGYVVPSRNGNIKPVMSSRRRNGSYSGWFFADARNDTAGLKLFARRHSFGMTMPGEAHAVSGADCTGQEETRPNGTHLRSNPAREADAEPTRRPSLQKMMKRRPNFEF